jgi:hypothetical protein
MIIDSSTAVDRNELPQGWREECMSVLERFYTEEEDILAIEAELLSIVNLEGGFGRDVRKYRDMLAVQQPAGKYQIQLEAEKQIKSLVIKPHLLWKLQYTDQFPKLTEPAIRMAVMATQSADVERVCKVHKIIHTKSRNRLKNKNVYMLLYCYVNLRLLKSMDQGGDLDKDDVLEDFLGQSILDTAEETVQGEVVAVDGANGDD